jgi:hypothetical protein
MTRSAAYSRIRRYASRQPRTRRKHIPRAASIWLKMPGKPLVFQAALCYNLVLQTLVTKGETMARTRQEMRLYQRERRARLKAAQPTVDPDWAVVDTTLSRDAITGASAAEFERVRAKAAAIGRAKAVVTQTNGRLDVVSREAFEARSPSAPSRAIARTPAAPPPPDAIRRINGGDRRTARPGACPTRARLRCAAGHSRHIALYACQAI